MSSKKETNPDEPYGTESQNAIFNFLFILVDEYSKQMPKQEAIEKACDWLISLATHIKKTSVEINEELLNKHKLFTET